MIVDASALVAILRREPDADRLASAIETSRVVRMSAATYLEASIVVGPPVHASLDAILTEAAIDVVAFDAAQARAARAAHQRYGRGSGSPARLNYGDCMSYALAAVTGEPLLFKGDDFAHTDVAVAPY